MRSTSAPPTGLVPSLDDARDFVGLMLDAPVAGESRPSASGRGCASTSAALAGTGLQVDGELVAVTAFGGR